MTDIVELLRTNSSGDADAWLHGIAADELARLRTLVRGIASQSDPAWAREMARREVGGVVMEVGTADPPDNVLIAGCTALSTAEARDELMTAQISGGNDRLALIKMRLRWRAMVREMRFPGSTAPVGMVLFCPACHRQHVDAPEPDRGWMNPPHRSHKCGHCGAIWRPADILTTGVTAITTRGKADNWPPSPANEGRDTTGLEAEAQIK